MPPRMLAEWLELRPAEIAPAAAALALSETDAALLRADHPFLRYGDWRMFAALEGGTVVARMVASVDPRQLTPLGDVGCIGFVGMPAGGPWAVAGRRTAERLLAAAVDWLRAREVAIVRCPVQLATTYGHRAMVGGLPEEGGAPAFPLEPRDGRALVDLLDATGFHAAHRAVSYAVRSASVIASTRRAVRRLRCAGLRDLALDIDRLDGELELLRHLSLDAFSGSWGFSEISLAEFLALYAPGARQVNRGLVRILRDRDGRAVGFGFAVPDVPKPSDGTGIVLKTLAVLPEARRRHLGAGPGLTAMLHEAAIAQGFRDGIHALMARGSNAHRLSMRWGTQIREYATFERVLR